MFNILRKRKAKDEINMHECLYVYYNVWQPAMSKIIII